VKASRTYKVEWSGAGLIELARIYAYPSEIKERVYLDALKRLEYMPTLSAKQIPFGEWEGYWARIGLYQVTLMYEVDEVNQTVWIDGVKHKREDLYWKKSE
jgi:hypothetical protein